MMEYLTKRTSKSIISLKKTNFDDVLQVMEFKSEKFTCFEERLQSLESNLTKLTNQIVSLFINYTYIVNDTEGFSLVSFIKQRIVFLYQVCNFYTKYRLSIYQVWISIPRIYLIYSIPRIHTRYRFLYKVYTKHMPGIYFFY